MMTATLVPRRSRRANQKRPSVLLIGLVCAVTLIFVAPLVYLVLGAWSGGRFWEILASESIRQPLFNSLALGISVAVLTSVVGTALAVLVSRTDLPGRRFWRVALALPLVIPSFVGATALLAATGRGGLLSAIPTPTGFWGAFLVLSLFSYPYVYLPVLARLATTSPSVEEASRLLGKPAMATVLRVLLPQLRTAIVGGGLLVFLYVLSDFGAVSLLRFDTLTRVIYGARLLDRELSLTLGLILAVLALAVTLLARGTVETSVPQVTRARARGLYGLGRWRPLGLIVVALPFFFGIVAPVVVFLIWVFRGSTTIGVGYSGWGDDLGFLASPLGGSTLAAVSAGVAAVVITLPVAFAVVRRSGRLVRLAGSVVTSVFALPGLVVALALVSWVINAPSAFGAFYQTFPLLILGYVLHFGAQSLRSSQSALGSVPPRFDEAAATLGAAAPRRFASIDLPLVLPGLLAAGGLVLLSTLKELPATLILAPIGFETLATVIWNAAEDGFYAQVGITSLTLIALSAVLTWALVLRRELSR
ncbi:MAG: iron ABC transporter permease [Actinomycetia bacterium]|nr:iron ABC transporter permease [Actinomycetes bacterium]